MARAKPSSAELTVSVDTVRLNKELRKQVVKKIIDSLPHCKIRQHEIYNLLKARYRHKGLGKTPSEKDIHKFSSVLDRVVRSLPHLLVINGTDKRYLIEVRENDEYFKVPVWLYDDHSDSRLCKQFFLKLEAAVEGYNADKILDSTRPTQKQVKEYFIRLEKDCERLESRLSKIDDGSRAFAESYGVDVDKYINYLDQLRQLRDYSATIEISKKSNARFNLCVAVGRAFNSIGIAATTSRLGLMDELICLIIQNITGDVIGDIQDTLRAALSKTMNVLD